MIFSCLDGTRPKLITLATLGVPAMVSSSSHRVGPILLVLCVLPLVTRPARGGTISGTVKDAGTMALIAGMDLDLFDSAKNPITTVNPVTNASGAYSITSLPAGQYYLRCDPAVTDPYVDQYYPGVFLESQAGIITVPASGTVTINF